MGPAYDLDGYDLVFADPIGRLTRPSTIRASWKRVRRETGLTTLRLHDLRHAHATYMVTLGIDARLVSERMGHATPAFTLSTYVLPLANAQAEAAERVADWLRRSS